MSKATIEQLRAEIDALPMSGRGRRYPAELRAPIAEMARASEQSYGRVAAALGKLEVTLTCWCQAPRDTRMAPDFYLANLELRHREDYVPNEGAPVHMITAFGNTARFTMHDVTISRFQGVPVNTGLGNSSIVMFTRGAPRANVAIVNCTQTGLNGAFTSTYSLRDSVIEKNQTRGAVLALADGSVPALYYIKGDNERVSVRANTFGRDNDWPAQLSPIGLSEARSIEILFNVIDTPYTSGRAGALRLWSNSPLSSYSWTADTPVWINRNSLRRRISWEGGALANMPDGTVRIESNAVDPACRSSGLTSWHALSRRRARPRMAASGRTTASAACEACLRRRSR